MSTPYYSEEDARDILKRATDIQTEGRDFSEAHLQQMAQELGITSEALVLAKEQHLAAQGSREEAAIRRMEEAEFDRYRRNALRIHLVVTALIIPILLGINLLTSPEFLWFFFPLFGMSAGLLGHYWGTRQSEGAMYEQQFEQWRKSNKPNLKRLTAGER